MGTGSSGLGKKSGGGAPAKANTPSGIDYNQFMAMSDDQKYQTLDNILNDSSIVVPSYLDNSETSKVIYALGMDNKPTVVSDAQLDTMPGADLYRTVYDTPNPPPYAKDILDQISTGDYTQMSGAGGSVHGRALYFADDFSGSRNYGNRGSNAKMMRAKLNSNANIVDEYTLDKQMRKDSKFMSSVYRQHNPTDAKALYAISHGIDGWNDGWSYTMMVNRGAMTVSSTYKHTKSYAKTPTGRIKRRNGQAVMQPARNWKSAEDVK